MIHIQAFYENALVRFQFVSVNATLLQSDLFTSSNAK